MAIAAETYTNEPVIRKVSWGAIFAGTLLGLVVLFTLSILGVAIGLTVLDPTERDPAAGLDIGATIWWIICSVLSLFLAGWAAARLSAAWVKTSGLLHGLVTWALSLLVLAWLLTSAAGAVMGGAFNLLQTGLRTGAQAAPQGAMQDIQQKLESATQEAQEMIEQQQQQTSEEDVEQAAKKAVDTGAAAAWWSFLMLLIGAAAAGIGGLIGSACNKHITDKYSSTTITT